MKVEENTSKIFKNNKRKFDQVENKDLETVLKKRKVTIHQEIIGNIQKKSKIVSFDVKGELVLIGQIDGEVSIYNLGLFFFYNLGSLLIKN
jgi:hypothetical protein